MKRIIWIIVACCCFNTVEAQLLKKLKDKAKQTFEPKKNSTTPNSGNGDAEANTNTRSSGDKTPAASWQPTPDCEKIFTLEKGEQFMYDETRVTGYNGSVSYAFVIRNKKYEYFLIEEGKRTGPFDAPPITQLRSRGSGGEGADETIEPGDDRKDPVALQYSKTINGKLFIVFNGKNYGPYDYVSKMKLSSDKKRFWAAVVIGGVNSTLAKMGMGNTFIVNEAGLKQKAGDENCMAVRMLVSDNFTSAALGLLNNATQKASVVSSAGKKQELEMMDLASGNRNGIRLAESGDVMMIPAQSPTQLMVNGTEAAEFKVPVSSVYRLLILPDYKKSLYFQGGRLYRGDGTEENLTDISFPKLVLLNGKPMLYYYKIHVTDTGDNDIYLCKKAL
jgi:hypothetical protein